MILFVAGLILGLTACGNKRTVVTVTQTVSSTPTTSSAATSAPKESAGDFMRRTLGYEIAGQWGREWDELHPVHQRLITRTQYDSCMRRDPSFTGNETIAVKETYDDPIDVPGIPQHVSKAVTIEVREPFEGGSATKQKATLHAVNVNGSWRWILAGDTVAAFRNGECTDGSKLPESSTKPPPPPPTKSAKAIRFAGNGTRQLAPITVRHDSTLRWTHDGDYFSVSDDDLDVNVDSQASKGQTYVPAGRYQFDVTADGNWTIVIR